MASQAIGNSNVDGPSSAVDVDAEDHVDTVEDPELNGSEEDLSLHPVDYESLACPNCGNAEPDEDPNDDDWMLCGDRVDCRTRYQYGDKTDGRKRAVGRARPAPAPKRWRRMSPEAVARNKRSRDDRIRDDVEYYDVERVDAGCGAAGVEDAPLLEPEDSASSSLSEDEWILGRIYGHRFRPGTRRRVPENAEARVSYQGFGPDSDLWIPLLPLLETAPEAVKQYYSRIPFARCVGLPMVPGWAPEEATAVPCSQGAADVHEKEAEPAQAEPPRRVLRSNSAPVSTAGVDAGSRLEKCMLPARGAVDGEEEYVRAQEEEAEHVRRVAQEAQEEQDRERETLREEEVRRVLRGGESLLLVQSVAAAADLTEEEWQRFPELPEAVARALAAGTTPTSAARAMQVTEAVVVKTFELLAARAAKFNDAKAYNWLHAFSLLVLRSKMDSTPRNTQHHVVRRALDTLAGVVSEDTLQFVGDLPEHRMVRQPRACEPGEEGEKARSSRAMFQIMEGDIKSATRTLTSVGASLETTSSREADEVIAAKFPRPGEAHPDNVEQAWFAETAEEYRRLLAEERGAKTVVVTLKMAQRALSTEHGFRNGTSAGDGGLSQPLLRRLVLSNKNTLGSFATMAQRLVDGEAPTEALMHTTLRGFVIRQGNKLRIGGMGGTVLRLVKRIAMMAIRSTFSDIFPENYMDASAGTLRATGMVRAELEEHMARAEVAFVVQADVANQHMAADRRKCLKLLGSHPRLRVLVPMYVAMLLGAPVRVRFDWDDRPPTFAMCEMGLPIGDPLAGIFSSAA